MDSFWDNIYLKNTLKDWTIAIGIFVVTVIVIRLFKATVFKLLKNWAFKTSNAYDDFIIRVIEKAIFPLLYIGSAYVAFHRLNFSVRTTRIVEIIFLFLTTFFVLKIISSFLHFLLLRIVAKHTENRETKEKQLRGILVIVNIIIWAIGLVFIIDNLGYDVTAVITGLGIGGIAIALAAQTILGDLFSYFVIFFDRPFEIGDFIIVDDKSGTVEYVGVKTTRIRSLSGEQLVFSNTNLTNSRVHNYRRMQTRRIVFKIGVVYQTPYQKLQQIPIIIKEIISAEPDVIFDRGHFQGYGDFSLNFEFVYHVQSKEYNVYMDVQQKIYLSIFERFEKEGIEFAYPTQSLFVNMQQDKNFPTADKTNIVE